MLSTKFVRIMQGLREGHLHVSSEQWPLFLYHDYSYDPDDPWKGLLRSSIIVSVRLINLHPNSIEYRCVHQAYKHIFTSPSSVGKEPKATRSGNARIHSVTLFIWAEILLRSTSCRFDLLFRLPPYFQGRIL
jgi:hypothetical protein